MKNSLSRGRAITGAIGGAVLIALSGCGGGSSGGGNGGGDQQDVPADITAPSVSDTYPASAETGVPRSAVVSAFFDEEVLASSVSDASFSLVGKGPVDGAVTFDASTDEATFTPSQPLAILTTYTATLGADIGDLAGNAMGAEFSWDFTTADGTLSTAAEPVYAEDTWALVSPKVIYDDNGDAIAVWEKYALDPTTSRLKITLWANHYRAGSGWGTPFLLQTTPDASSADVSLAADNSGNAIVGWREDNTDVWMRHYDHSTDTWGSAVKLNTAGVTAITPKIALDNRGNAIALWMEQVGGVYDIRASYYTHGEGWGVAENIENGAGDIYGYQVALDGSGNAIAVWTQVDGTYTSNYANHFVAGAGWGTPTLLENDDSSNAEPPQLSVDASGNALAIWLANDGTRRNLWYNHYDATDGWGGAALLEERDTDIGWPELAMNSSGTAIVTWANYDAAAGKATYASKRYVPGQGWGAEETFNYTGSNYYHSDVAIDENGNALFFWEYDDGTNGTLWFNRYTADGGWAAATQLTSMGNDYGDSSPAVSVNSQGEGMVIFNGTATNEQQLWTRLFK